MALGDEHIYLSYCWFEGDCIGTLYFLLDNLIINKDVTTSLITHSKYTSSINQYIDIYIVWKHSHHFFSISSK